MPVVYSDCSELFLNWVLVWPASGETQSSRVNGDRAKERHNLTNIWSLYWSVVGENSSCRTEWSGLLHMHIRSQTWVFGCKDSPETLFGVDCYFAPGLLRYGSDTWVVKMPGCGGIWETQRPSSGLKRKHDDTWPRWACSTWAHEWTDLRRSRGIWCRERWSRRWTQAQPWAFWTRGTHGRASLPADSTAREKKTQQKLNRGRCWVGFHAAHLSHLTQVIALLKFLRFNRVSHLLIGHPERLDCLFKVLPKLDMKIKHI